MKYILIIFPIVLLSSCSLSSDSKNIQKIVEEWQGKSIVLPNDMTDFMTGDTIDLSDADFTILTYIDSVGCYLCKMKLPLWKEFLCSLDSICDYNIRFLMIVYPSDNSELNYVLKQDQFDYPIYLDVGNKFSKINSLPNKQALQTFLIDRNEKVMAIGNPLYSSEIGKLYRNIIDGKMSVSAETGDFVSINDSRISLGDLRLGEKKSREVVFSNHSNDTVNIRKVVSSCDCTELSLPIEYISPKSDLKAVVHFIGDTITGYFDRTLHIYYSEYNYPTIITVTGNIIR